MFLKIHPRSFPKLKQTRKQQSLNLDRRFHCAILYFWIQKHFYAQTLAAIQSRPSPLKVWIPISLYSLLPKMARSRILQEYQDRVDQGQPLITASNFLIISLRDGFSHQARFSNLFGIAVDNEGSIYLTDRGDEDHHGIRKISLIQWHQSNHKHFSESTRNEIKSLIILSTNPKSFISRLPRDILYVLCYWTATP